MNTPSAPPPNPVLSVAASSIVGGSLGLAMFGPPAVLAGIAVLSVASVAVAGAAAKTKARSALAHFLTQPVQFMHACAWCGALVGGVVIGLALH